MDANLNKLENELLKNYCYRLYRLKDSQDLSWGDIADLVNAQYGTEFSKDKFRKEYKKDYDLIFNVPADSISENSTTENNSMVENNVLVEIKKEKAKLSDERVQLNAMYRKIAREETLKEMAIETARIVVDKFPLIPINKSTNSHDTIKSNAEGLLLISDWHFGIEVNNIYNVYSPEIAIERVNKLTEEVILRCKKNNIKKITVANLGDLIAGIIHLPIRVTSRYDVITQIQLVTELYAELLAKLANANLEVTTYSVLDNHSRIDPNKKDSIQLESLARFTDWYLKQRLKEFKNITICDNCFDINIATFNILGYKIAGVHGDLDKPNTIVESLTSFTKEHFDLIVSAHLHHFSTNESNDTVVVCNGSLMGTDDYAFNLRLNSKPSQTFIIVTPNSVCEEIHRIVLD